ncbi:MAG: agmatinase [Desulfamplus sp.]|nr:agmatinase [Desulfamplus sp.]
MRFLESEIVQDKYGEGRSLFHVILAPMEISVSYEKGTALAPDAIIEASEQLEAWDNSQSVAVIRESGIYTALPVDCDLPNNCDDPEIILGRIEDAVTRALSFSPILVDGLQKSVIPVLLGGEHTVTLGALRAIKKHLIKEFGEVQNGEFGIIQLDAHADLRDSYQGSRLSHASVMRRAVDDLNLPLFQIGVRAISQEELMVRKERKIAYIDPKDIYIKGAQASLFENPIPSDFPKKIYITLDVDGLDPSVIRATGTPVPGGVGWYDTLILLEKIIASREVVGFDVVELAPIKGDHASTFAASQLAYSVMGMIQRFAK